MKDNITPKNSDFPASDNGSGQSEKAPDNAKMIVILNPASGSVKKSDSDSNDGQSEFLQQVEAELQKHGADYQLLETTPEINGDQLAAQAAKDGARHIVICGGDGTVMSAINGLFGGDGSENNDRPTVSIVPGGTANLLATALGIPADIEEAVKVAVSGIDYPIDLGRCGEHVFALGLGLGLTEKLVSQASAEEKEKLGKLAYAKAMLGELGAAPTRFRFRLNDGPEQHGKGVAIVIANAGDIGGNLQFAPDARMNDGQLDLCILHRFYFRDCARMIVKMIMGSLPEDRAVTFSQAHKIEILSEPPLDLQIDGEVVDETTPLTAEVVPTALTVRVPPEYLDKQQEQDEAKADQSTLAPVKRHPALFVAPIAIILGAAFWLWRRKR